jgi:hypothetical protein
MYIKLDDIDKQEIEKNNLVENEINDYIDKFVIEFRQKFNLIPTVTIEFPEKRNKFLRGLPLSELIRMVNNRLFLYNPRYFPEGIRKRTRDKVIVTHRYIYFHIARSMRYTLKEIGAPLGKDHATVMYGINKINDLLDTGIYPDINDPYYDCTKEVNERIFGPGSLQSVPETPVESESDVYAPQL